MAKRRTTSLAIAPGSALERLADGKITSAVTLGRRLHEVVERYEFIMREMLAHEMKQVEFMAPILLEVINAAPGPLPSLAAGDDYRQALINQAFLQRRNSLGHYLMNLDAGQLVALLECADRHRADEAQQGL